MKGFVPPASERNPFYMHSSDLSVGWVEPFNPEPFGPDLTAEGLPVEGLMGLGSSRGIAIPLMHGLCSKSGNG